MGKVPDKKKIKTVLSEFDISSKTELGLGIYGGLKTIRKTLHYNRAQFQFGINLYDKALKQNLT